MKTKLNKGYVLINLSKNGKQITYRVHTLVAEAFIPNPNKYKEINHIDENKSNNKVENLEWCTRKYNCNYGNIQKLIHKNRYISVLQYDLEGNLINKFYKILEAEKQTKIDHSSITKCCKGKVKTAGGFIWKYAQQEISLDEV